MEGPRVSALTDLSEAAFLRQVIDLANVRGWRSAHFHDSRRQVTRRGRTFFIGDAAAAGFPDLNLVRAPRVVYAELKSRTGRLSLAQERWLEELRGCPGVEVYVWRPADFHEIERALA